MPNLTPQQYRDYMARMEGPVAIKNSTVAVSDEAELHQQIIADCRRRGWISLHGSMAHSTFRTVGEWDFTILADGGRILLIECKTKVGKLSTEQQGMIAWAKKLGHTVHVIRSFEEFISTL
jgi:hypothetical protein